MPTLAGPRFPAAVNDVDMGEQRMVFQDLAAGCGGYVDRVALAPRSCEVEPTMVGLKMYRERSGRRHVVRGFACDRHTAHFDVYRPIEGRDRAILDRRRERERVELAGRVWEGEREVPLAWGREADELLERARAWSAAQR